MSHLLTPCNTFIPVKPGMSWGGMKCKTCSVPKKDHPQALSAPSATSHATTTSPASATNMFTPPPPNASSPSKRFSLKRRSNPATPAIPTIDQLTTCAVTGDIPTAQLLNLDFLDLNSFDKHGHSALYTAASANQLEFVKYLVTMKDVKFKVDVDHPIGTGSVNGGTDDGNTPLYIAALNGHVAIVQYLVAEATADVNKTNNDLNMPLFAASQNGYLAIVVWLMERGAVVDAATVAGYTALHAAAHEGHFEVVQQLVGVGGAAVGKVNVLKKTPIDLAEENGHKDCAEWMRARQALIQAEEEEKGKELRLLELGKQLVRAAEEGSGKAVQALVKSGADVNRKDVYSDGQTVLLIAARCNNLSAVKTLLHPKCKADVNALSAEACPMAAIHTAVIFGNVDVLQLLCEDERTDVMLVNGAGKNALEIAEEQEAAAEPLLRGGDGKQQWSNITEIIRNAISDRLQRAATEGDVAQVKSLSKTAITSLALSADKTPKTETPLYAAAYHGHLDVLEFLVSQDKSKINATVNGYSALHTASHQGHLSTVQFLAQSGADLHALDAAGRTPRVIARESHNYEVAAFLKSKGVKDDADDERIAAEEQQKQDAVDKKNELTQNKKEHEAAMAITNQDRANRLKKVDEERRQAEEEIEKVKNSLKEHQTAAVLSTKLRSKRAASTAVEMEQAKKDSDDAKAAELQQKELDHREALKKQEEALEAAKVAELKESEDKHLAVGKKAGEDAKAAADDLISKKEETKRDALARENEAKIAAAHELRERELEAARALHEEELKKREEELEAATATALQAAEEAKTAELKQKEAEYEEEMKEKEKEYKAAQDEAKTDSLKELSRAQEEAEKAKKELSRKEIEHNMALANARSETPAQATLDKLAGHEAALANEARAKESALNSLKKKEAVHQEALTAHERALTAEAVAKKAALEKAEAEHASQMAAKEHEFKMLMANMEAIKASEKKALEEIAEVHKLAEATKRDALAREDELQKENEAKIAAAHELRERELEAARALHEEELKKREEEIAKVKGAGADELTKARKEAVARTDKAREEADERADKAREESEEQIRRSGSARKEAFKGGVLKKKMKGLGCCFPSRWEERRVNINGDGDLCWNSGPPLFKKRGLVPLQGGSATAGGQVDRVAFAFTVVAGGRTIEFALSDNSGFTVNDWISRINSHTESGTEEVMNPVVENAEREQRTPSMADTYPKGEYESDDDQVVVVNKMSMSRK